MTGVIMLRFGSVGRVIWSCVAFEDVIMVLMYARNQNGHIDSRCSQAPSERFLCRRYQLSRAVLR
jgi:hypothetical protein